MIVEDDQDTPHRDEDIEAALGGFDVSDEAFGIGKNQTSASRQYIERPQM